MVMAASNFLLSVFLYEDCSFDLHASFVCFMLSFPKCKSVCCCLYYGEPACYKNE